LPGKFDLRQTSWTYPKGNSAGVFNFSLAFNPKIAPSYEVPCVADDVLRCTLLKNV